MKDCLFCKIATGKIPADIVYQDEKVIAFRDINPAAPVHLLIIPKQHMTSLLDLNDENATIISHLFSIIVKLAKQMDIEQTGFRVVNNCGENGGQTVQHLHFHLLGGRSMAWPPG